MKLSFIVVTKNSEKIIEKLLNSVLSVCDEIIVIDNGSTDSTRSKVRKFTSKIFVCKLSGRNFLSKLRTLGKKKAVGDWILSLDSDEVLSTEAAERIPVLIRDINFDGYWFRRRNYLSDSTYLKHSYFYPDYQLCLFRNKEIYKYSSELHTRIIIPQNITKEIDVDIFHFSQYPKYVSIRNLVNFRNYVISDALDLLDRESNLIVLFSKGVTVFFIYFFNGYIRGKGFLDGNRGFIANLNFSIYISLSYILAFYLKILNIKLSI